jgi:DNA-cytosine methyltransferase
VVDIKELKVFEAFSGYGSQSIALKNIRVNHSVVAISEIDKDAIKAYNVIHDNEIDNLGDISNIDIDRVPDHDLFTYSFPCQSISTAGLKEGLKEKSNTKSSLLWECQEIIKYKQPKYLMMENVKNLISKKHIDDFHRWCKWLEEQGYKNYWKVLDACGYGIPQRRNRVFMISIHNSVDKEFVFPNHSEISVSLLDFLEDEVDSKYYKIKPSVQKNIDVLKPLIDVCDKDIFVPTQKQVSVGRQDHLIGIKLTSCLRVNGYTLVLDKTNRIRRLTPKEYWMLMGVDSNTYDKVLNAGFKQTQLYKLAGNSIVINVLEEIFKNLFSDYIIENN